MKTISRYIMTLALLLTAVTGAWADGKVYTSAVDITALKVGDILTEGASINGSGSIIFDLNRVKVNGTLQTEGFIYLYTSDFDSFGAEGVISLSNNSTISPVDKDNNDGNAWEVTNVENNNYIHIQGITYAPAPDGPEVTWDAATKTGTFAMPAFDVEITPIYAPTAQWAKVENVDQLPTAIEGIYAESTDAIVKAGTVAKIGETENVQGTVMYAVTSTNQAAAPALTAFSATLPTAKDITAAGDVLVWYYIKGADTPDGQEATAENTFDDSEICTTPIKVTVLSNKFDITFNAANANTIESGKATVTVGGTAATVTEGKLEGVKMGSEVKVKAKEGYKFRKVEVKKKSAYEHSITIAVDPGTTVPTANAPAMTIEFNTGETWADVAARYDWLDTYETYTVYYKDDKLMGNVHDANGGVKPNKTIDPNGSYHWGM